MSVDRHNELLGKTIFNPDKSQRKPLFEQAWVERWVNKNAGYFQTTDPESPFTEFSSKGWKIHAAFNKGYEKEFASFLFLNGMCFKVEGGSTFFHPLKASGATVYIGGYRNMLDIAEYISINQKAQLVDGVVLDGDIYGRRVNIGSGSDIEIYPKITARFDVAKTPFGWVRGNGKYTEMGIRAWYGLAGLPILKDSREEVMDLTNSWNSSIPEQRQLLYRRLMVVYQTSRAELIKDFGEEFVTGSTPERPGPSLV